MSAQAWRVVCEGGEVREAPEPEFGGRFGGRWTCEDRGWHATQRAAVLAWAFSCALPVVEILSPGEVPRTELTATIDALRANTVALGEEVVAMEDDRDAARAQVAGLRAAVVAYLAALDVLPGDLATINAAIEREAAARAALDALLSGGSPDGTRGGAGRRGPDEELARALHLAGLALAFGRVERATRHDDGLRPETDTDHTVMLGLVACELAPAGLDRSKVAAFALVHDLAEVYCGDTQTLVISPEAMTAKAARERAARERLVAELGAGSWVAETLSTYEEQRQPEARFVRLIDKVLPKLTHAFNGCAGARALTDREGFVGAHVRQFQHLSEEYSEFQGALDLLAASMAHAEACWPGAVEVLPPGEPSRAELVAEREAAEALRATLPRCEGHGRTGSTLGLPCDAIATQRATWGRFDWQRVVCADCGAQFRAETACSLEPLPWADALLMDGGAR